MTIIEDINRIQSYLRESARKSYEMEHIPPFSLFFHPTDPFQFYNYAIPDEPTCGDLGPVLARLRESFQRHKRRARFEFFEAFAPHLPQALRENGFVEEARQWSMVCTPETLVSAMDEVPGLTITMLNASSSNQDILDFIFTQRQGFDPSLTTQPNDSDIDRWRQGYQMDGWQSFLGRIEGQPAGVSAFGTPINGVSEVAGIATLVPFRRRGIASRLTWEAVHLAFERGVKTACLTAADENAGRVYERVGFSPFSVMLAYLDER